MKHDELIYTNDASLPTLVHNLIITNREAAYWDFKREWHDNNAELVHDIICLANNPKGNTALLIIGVADEPPHELYDVEQISDNRKNSQQLTDLLSKLSWAESAPEIRVTTIQFGDSKLDIILIEPDDEAVPYRLNMDYDKDRKTVRAGAVYSRVGDTNTPINSTADTLATERLWRRHFGLDKTPIERLPQLLSKPSKWHSTNNPTGDENGSQSCYYYDDHPEYTYVCKQLEDWSRHAFFMLASPFFNGPDWWLSSFYYHQTLIYEVPGAYSDHLYIPEPSCGSIRKTATRDTEHVSFYGYYLHKSVETQLIQFMLDESKEGPSATEELKLAFELIPVFHSENERWAFESWAGDRWDTINELTIQEKRVFGASLTDVNDKIPTSIIERAKLATVIVRLLDEFRGV